MLIQSLYNGRSSQNNVQKRTKNKFIFLKSELWNLFFNYEIFNAAEGISGFRSHFYYSFSVYFTQNKKIKPNRVKIQKPLNRYLSIYLQNQTTDKIATEAVYEQQWQAMTSVI